jgi:ribosomal protein S18 acetylase RimI-like enzyme
MQEIIELERTAAAHWRGTEEQWLGGWLLRAAEGFTGRANSVLPLGDPGLPLDAALVTVAGWYRARGLPPMIVIPTALDTAPAAETLDNHLSQRSWTSRPGPAFVMVADLPLPGLDQVSDPLPTALAVQVTSEPGDAWAAMYHYRGQEHLPPVAREVLTSAEAQSFVSLRAAGELLAIARLSVAGGWAGLTAVEVSPAHRRRGLGTAITAAACQEASRRGLTRVFLQVEVTNAPARALYERLGFRYSHRYHYRVAPS